MMLNLPSHQGCMRTAACILLALTLTACAAAPGQPEAPKPVPIAEAKPIHTKPDPTPATPAKPTWPMAPAGVTVLNPDEESSGAATHRLALLENEPALPAGDLGYYLDNMEARLIQKVRDDRIVVVRSEYSISISIAGADAFDSGGFSLKPGTQATLLALAEVLEEYRETQVTISGHTDDSGPEHYNQKLSEQRAFALASFLLDAGVAAQRLVTIGYGESKPLVANDSEAARSENRRIELHLVPLTL